MHQSVKRKNQAEAGRLAARSRFGHKEMSAMNIGERLRFLRKEKGLSLSTVEHRSGLYASFVSRIENGHSVPGLETLERLARALNVPMYQLFYDGHGTLKHPNSTPTGVKNGVGWEMSKGGIRFWIKFRRLLADIDEEDRRFLLGTAQRMSRLKKRLTSRREEKTLHVQDRAHRES